MFTCLVLFEVPCGTEIQAHVHLVSFANATLYAPWCHSLEQLGKLDNFIHNIGTSYIANLSRFKVEFMGCGSVRTKDLVI